jgi:CheY-like chemotaxis protein
MAGPAPAAQPEGRSILVVDDDPVFAGVVEDILKIEGYRVSIATSGLTALEIVGAAPFDLILIDIRMPELDGPGFFRELQSRDPELARRVMFMTGGAVEPDVAELLFSLRVPYLRKPLSVDELRAAVRRFFLAARSFPGFRKPGQRG